MPKKLNLLVKLLGNISLKEFVSDYWEKKPLIIPNAKISPFNLSLQDVESLLATPSLSYPYFDIVSDGKRIVKKMILPRKNVIKSTMFEANIPFLHKQFCRGETIVVQKAHLLSSSLYKASQELENQIFIKSGINIYIS